MKILITFLILPFILGYNGIEFGSAYNGTIGLDTSYIKVDTTSINKPENTFDLILLLKSGGKQYEIYRVKNQDYSIDFKYNFSYLDNKNNYVCYTVYSLPEGSRWDIIYDKVTNSFYKTDVYDLKALGDEIVKKSIDFKKRLATVSSTVVKTIFYNVKLKKIWEPTEKFKQKTMIL